VLTHVSHRVSGGGLRDLYGSNLFDASYGRTLGRNKIILRMADHPNTGPRRVIEVRVCPPRFLKTRVVGLSLIDLRRDDRSRRDLPPGPARDELLATALVHDLDLTKKRRLVAVSIPLSGKPDLSSIPAAAQHRANRVCALTQEPGDVVGLI